MRCADKATRAALICQTCRSCTLVTPGMAASVTGVAVTVAFATTLYNPTRFADASQVSAYLGLVPREHSSGEKRSQGGITKVGNRVTRGLLIEAAWCIIKSDNEAVADLRQWALAIQARRGKQRAAVALARRLSRILFAMWRDNPSFKPHHRSAAALAA